MSPIKKSIFKLFSLCILLGGLWLIMSEESVRADGACYTGYLQCQAACALNTMPGPDRDACMSGCLMPYGVCTNNAIFNAEGQILGTLPETQAMPILSDFRVCLHSCPVCPMANYVEDLEGFIYCMEEKLACKSACLEQFGY